MLCLGLDRFFGNSPANGQLHTWCVHCSTIGTMPLSRSLLALPIVLFTVASGGCFNPQPDPPGGNVTTGDYAAGTGGTISMDGGTGGQGGNGGGGGSTNGATGGAGTTGGTGTGGTTGTDMTGTGGAETGTTSGTGGGVAGSGGSGGIG